LVPDGAPCHFVQWLLQCVNYRGRFSSFLITLYNYILHTVCWPFALKLIAKFILVLPFIVHMHGGSPFKKIKNKN